MGREINKEQLKLIRAEQKNQSGNKDRRAATGDTQKDGIIEQWGKHQTRNLEEDMDGTRKEFNRKVNAYSIKLHVSKKNERK